MTETVFMVMPFGDALAATAYQYVTKPVAELFGLKIIRADEIFSANPVFDDIVTAIEQAGLVIVDISGKNANCYYELGTAHTLKRSRTIMITHDEYYETPFDIAHFRIIKYADSIKGREDYEHSLRETIHSILSGIEDLYQKEFLLVSTTLSSSGDDATLYFAIALAKTTQEVVQGQKFEIDGAMKSGDGSSTHGHSNANAVRPLFALNYLSTVNGKFTLTEKGRAFVNFLMAQGYVCHYFNGEKFTEGYESFFERSEKQQQAVKANAEKAEADEKEVA
jgi:hypothetical protein